MPWVSSEVRSDRSQTAPYLVLRTLWEIPVAPTHSQSHAAPLFLAGADIRQILVRLGPTQPSAVSWQMSEKTISRLNLVELGQPSMQFSLKMLGLIR